MGKILNANRKYQQMRNRLDTSVVIGEPSIDGYGFSVYLEEYIGKENKTFELFVKADEEIIITKDLTALIMASLMLDKYKYISFDFDIGRNTLEEIKAITKAREITVRSLRADNERQGRENWTVNFSSGVDSTALHLICPELIRVSIDFTGTDNSWDAAGREMFTEVNSRVVKTNAHEFLLPHYTIGYYNLASLLRADSDKIRYAVVSRIMTDSIRTMQTLEKNEPAVSDFPDEIYGVRVLYPLSGMTKIGTQSVAAKLAPENYKRTIEASVFGDGQKVQSRLLIDECLTGESRDITLSVEASPPLKYGDNPLFDFYVFYFINRLGEAKASTFVNEIPQEVVDTAKALKLDFYEKYDPRALENIPRDFAEHFLTHLIDAGIELYTDEDYAERSQIVNALGIGEGV